MTADLLWAPIDSFPGNTTSPDLMRMRACPWCDGRRFQSLVEIPGFQFFSDSDVLPKRVDICQVRCQRCGGLFMNPVYSERGLSVLFAEASCSFGAPTERYPTRARWLLDHARPEAGDTVLDLGCHEGRMLSLLPENLHRLGVDLDTPAIERGRRSFPQLDLRAQDATELELSPPPAVVSLFHVLEHLSDPVDTLTRLHGMAGPRMRLVIEVPVLESAVARDVVGFFTIHHVTHFTRASLVSLLARAGWETTFEDPSDPKGFRVVARPTTVPPTGTALPDEPLDSGVLARDFLARQQAVVDGVNARLCAVPDGPVVLWGAGNHTEMLYQRSSWFASQPERLLALVDSDAAKHGTRWRGVAVHAPEVLRSVDWSRAWLVVSSHAGRHAIVEAAGKLGVPAERIVDPYAESAA